MNLNRNVLVFINSTSLTLNINKSYFSTNKPKHNYNESSKHKPRISNDTEHSDKLKIDEKWKKILGRTGPNKRSHVIALEQLNSGKTVTAKKINEILAYCGITVTDEQLKDLLNTPSFVLTNLNRKATAKKILKDKIGTPHSKNKVCGIYIFTHVSTGKKYVGSSSELALRLNGYINFTHKRTGLLIPLLNKEKLNNFSLEIFPFFSNEKKKSEVVLEQYYLLNPMFTLNTIRLANNPSGSNAKCLYMYNRDASILYYSSTQQVDFIRNFNVHHTSFTKHLNNGTYYLGKYLFLREPALKAKIKDMSQSEVTLMLEADRVKFNKNKK